jgi:hypothetical protein
MRGRSFILEEVLPLASSRQSLNQIDMTDMATAWAAFEEINKVTVTLTLCRGQRGANLELRLQGAAVTHQEVAGAPSYKVLVSASSWVFDHRSLDSAVFHLLYTLDGLIASEEMSNADKK